MAGTRITQLHIYKIAPKLSKERYRLFAYEYLNLTDHISVDNALSEVGGTIYDTALRGLQSWNTCDDNGQPKVAGDLKNLCVQAQEVVRPEILHQVEQLHHNGMIDI